MFIIEFLVWLFSIFWVILKYYFFCILYLWSWCLIIVFFFIYITLKSPTVTELRPITLLDRSNKTVIELLYIGLHNLSFDIIYFKLTRSWDDILQTPLLIIFLKRIVFYFITGLPYLVVKISKLTFSSLGYSFIDFLFLTVSTFPSNRVIIRENNRWVAY